MSTRAVLVERIARVLVLTINRPGASNAVDRAVWDGLAKGLSAAAANPDVGAVVITGAGDRSFCAGADLKAAANRTFQGDQAPRAEQAEWGFAGVVNHPIDKPVIAAVNGAAMGGGFEIVLACDLAIAAESARFGFPEVGRGLIAGGGGAFRLTHRIPHVLAMELLLTGDPIDARRAGELGLVNAVVPAADVRPRAVALATRIAANAPLAVQATKRIAHGIVDGHRERETSQWQRSADEVRRILASLDAREGPRAFAEKRPPVWRGR